MSKYTAAERRAAAKIMGHFGGTVTRERYGRAHYQEIGQRGGQKCAAVHGPAFYARIGRRAFQLRVARRQYVAHQGNVTPREAREAAGLTQRQMGGLLGVGQPRVCAMEACPTAALAFKKQKSG